MRGNRKWWLLSAGIRAPIGQQYHWLGKDDRTACGIQMPTGYARFVAREDILNPKLMKSKRCPACLKAREKH